MKYIFSAMVAGLLIMLGLLLNLYISFKGELGAELKQDKPLYHVAVITRESNDPFWIQFRNGASEAGKKLNVFVEFIEASHKDANEIEAIMDKAILADVDAIALQPNDIDMTSKTLEKASAAGIKVITFENDIFYIPNVPSVGSNSYEIGYTLGQMAAEASNGRANAAILLNDSGLDHTHQYNNIKLQGILEAFSEYSDMNADHIYSLNTNVFEVEKLTSSILSENPEIDMIICSDERNTPGVAQVLIDSGRVGEIKVVGFGAMPQTMNYIERGVIYGTVCPNSHAIGYNSVNQLFEMLQGKQTSEYFNTNIYTFTLDNLSDYQKNLSTEAGQVGR